MSNCTWTQNKRKLKGFSFIKSIIPKKVLIFGRSMTSWANLLWTNKIIHQCTAKKNQSKIWEPIQWDWPINWSKTNKATSALICSSKGAPSKLIRTKSWPLAAPSREDFSLIKTIVNPWTWIRIRSTKFCKVSGFPRVKKLMAWACIRRPFQFKKLRTSIDSSKPRKCKETRK